MAAPITDFKTVIAFTATRPGASDVQPLHANGTPVFTPCTQAVGTSRNECNGGPFQTECSVGVCGVQTWIGFGCPKAHCSVPGGRRFNY